jgi:hypothetical protein
MGRSCSLRCGDSLQALQRGISSLSLGLEEAAPTSTSASYSRDVVVAKTLATMKQSSAFGMKKLRGTSRHLTSCSYESIVLAIELALNFCSLGVLRL